MTVTRAHGARVNGLIDFTSGWLVANVGHDNRRVMRAARRAHAWAVIDRFENPHRVAAEAALRSTLPDYFDRILFYSSGSEAIDAAMRFVDGPVVAHPKAFHGSTIGAQSIPRAPFSTPPPYSNLLIETFHGAWCEWHSWAAVDAWKRHQAAGNALIFDEMQSGAGRTGKWWGFEHYDIQPDLVVGGKGIAGGFPLAFVAGRHGMMDHKRDWESTFSGNAISCAACVATIKEIKRRKLLQRVRWFENVIREAFPEAQGKGFAYAFEHRWADEVVDGALERGLLLLHTGRGTVKISPPLTIGLADLKRGLEILRSIV